MIRTITATLIALLVLAGSVAAQPRPSGLVDGLEPADPKYLSEVTRHLYRWYLDENDVLPSMKRGRFLFWVHETQQRLDENDNSRFAEITLPDIGIKVSVKKADYAIPELELEVRSDAFRITHVARIKPSAEKPADAEAVEIKYVELRDYLFKTRNQITPPDDFVLVKLRQAAGEYTYRYLVKNNLQRPDSATIHLGPVSPVANETWAYWEEGRVLYRFSSDMPIDIEDFWEHAELAVDLYSIEDQVVASLDEVAGSNAYLTRDHVGRVLFNCLVFGRRVEVTNPNPLDNPEP
ncbi:hypothetical protein [Mucisphaera calidilacus]|uniref:DUF3857 domain-containing protein n=1 Tax=Mucisphaera calidilacus TaxID=2527982 RepID=A0A518BYH4_9BACT|nr:hypothetical protein [Mucisphaera calidilacus]QDU72025.1 hypothetical protein Pan265_18850 [Mucisphaera calidilacus]